MDDDFFPPCDPELDDTLRWVSVLEELHFPLSRDEPFFTASLLSSESDDDIFKVNLDAIFMTQYKYVRLCRRAGPFCESQNTVVELI